MTMRFALFGNVHHPEKSAVIRRLLTALKRHGAQIAIDQHFYDFLSTLPDNPLHETHYSVFTEMPSCDFALSLGGDGTLLKTASRVRSRQVPIVGVNMGRMGFLADVGADDVEACVDALYEGDYSVDDRALIQVSTNGEHIEGYDCALNDVAILKRDTASMISIRASIDGEHLATYQADGLIVSTPTGSTAYSLSNGGPIITPRTGVFLMTAVAPHSLNIRPIVVRDDAEITLSVESRNHNFLIAIDGRSEKCEEGTRLTIRKAPYCIKIVKRNGHKYFSTLREKMTWGLDNRG